MARDRSGSRTRRRSVSQQREPLEEGVEEAEETARGLVDRAKQFFGLRIPTSPIQGPGGGIGGGGGVDLTPPDDDEDEGRDRDRNPTSGIGTGPAPGVPGGGPIQNPGGGGTPDPESDPEPDPDPLPSPGPAPSQPGGGGPIQNPGGGGGSEPDPEPALAIFDASINKSYMEAGEQVEITTTVNNSGDAGGTITLDYTIAGEQIGSRDVTVDANSEKTVTDAVTIGSSKPPNSEIQVNAVGAGRIDVAPRQPDGVAVVGCSGLPSEGAPGGFVNIDVQVQNTGGVDAVTTLTVELGGDEVASKEVTISSGTTSETKTVGFDLPTQPGDYTVTAGKRDTGPA